MAESKSPSAQDGRKYITFGLCLLVAQVTPSYCARVFGTFADVPVAASKSKPAPSNALWLILLQRILSPSTDARVPSQDSCTGASARPEQAQTNPSTLDWHVPYAREGNKTSVGAALCIMLVRDTSRDLHSCLHAVTAQTESCLLGMLLT